MKDNLLLGMDTLPYTTGTPLDNSKYILGPPGTGKTTEVIRQMEALIHSGATAADMSYISFTKKMADDGVRRLNLRLTKHHAHQYGTLHSVCLKHLMRANKKYNFMTIKLRPLSGAIKKFLGYCPKLVYSGDDEAVRNGYRTVVAAYKEYRSTLGCRTLSKREREFATAYRRAVKVTGALDYHDMLLVAAYEGVKLDADYVFVDEAQDLSPLMIETLRILTRDAKQVVFALDDDQSMYEFMGAEPSFWVRTAKGRTTVLEQSYRVPSGAHKTAVALITKNKNRVEKVYYPKKERGSVIHYRDLDKAIRDCGADNGVILARTNKILSVVATYADTLGYFYASHSGECGPFDLGGEGSLVTRLLYPETKPSTVSLYDLSDLLGFIKVRGKNAPTAFHDMLPSQSKAPIRKLIASEGKNLDIPLDRSTLAEVFDGKLAYVADLFAFLYSVERPHKYLTGLPEDYSRRLDSVMDNYGRIPEPTIHLSTFHSFKGLEHHSVYICTDIGPKAESEMVGRAGFEVENRAMYVALTRTSDKLGIIHSPIDGGHMFRGLFT